MPDERGAGIPDQEQAERGASTVSNRGYWISQASLDDIAEREVQLRTNLERVTAERDAMREVCDLAREEARRHTKGSFAVTTVSKRHYCKGCSSNGQPWPCEAKPMIDAIARLDATRKATADAAEEGK